jgi:hypothetical protein
MPKYWPDGLNGRHRDGEENFLLRLVKTRMAPNRSNDDWGLTMVTTYTSKENNARCTLVAEHALVSSCVNWIPR